MSARDNLSSALVALEASATSLDAAVTAQVAAHVNVMGDADVQLAADNVFKVINILQGAADKLQPKA